MRALGINSLENEAAWKRAKEIAASEYPEATGSNYWRVVESIYQKIIAYIPKSTHGDHDPSWRMAR